MEFARTRPFAVLLLLGLAFVAVFAAACADDDGAKNGTNGNASDEPTPIEGVSTAARFPFEFLRSDGKTLTVSKPVERVVSLSPGATEIIFALGAENRLVAVDNQADFPDGARNFATKVDAFQPNIEAITALNPDLVIVATDTGDIVGGLDRLNIPLLYTDLDTSVKTINDVFGQIGVIGRLTEKDAEAQALIAGLTARVKAVETALVPLEATDGPTVYHELDSTFYSVAEQTFIGSIYKTLKATNIAGDGGGTAYPQLTQETIIAKSPEIIVLADEEFGVTIESVKARPGWDTIRAVQEDRIFGVDPDIMSRPGPRIVDALEQLARDFYPQAFQ